jgi:integrase
MAQLQPSRNPFSAAGTPSLADLIARLRADARLELKARQNQVWALRTIARVCGAEPSAMPAHPDFLRRAMAKASPMSCGLTPAAWANARSLARAALERAGVLSIPGRYQAPLTGAWADLWAKLPKDTALQYQLSRLFHYGAAAGLEPKDLNDAVLATFEAALTAESIVANPYAACRGAAKSWNNAGTRIAGWPDIQLSVPRKQVSSSLPWYAFPTSLSLEVEAHLAGLARIDLDGEHAAPMRPQTIATRRKQMLWFANALVKAGRDPASLDSLMALVRPETARQGFEHLLDSRAGERFTALANLAEFLPALARRIGAPADWVTTLTGYKRKLRLERHGMAERHRPTLRRLDDPAAVDALLGLPGRIEDIVLAAPRFGARQAKLLQTAVAVELLLFAPVRLSNLASIQIGRHLVVVGRAPTTMHLRFPAHEVKNAKELEFPLPGETHDLIELYIRKARPLLATRPSAFLFPGQVDGRPKSAEALRHDIKTTVHRFIGLDMPPHRFRHAVGKIFLDRNPGQYEVVRQLLGHKDIATTITFYAGEEGAAAARHYAATILGLRGPAKGTS